MENMVFAFCLFTLIIGIVCIINLCLTFRWKLQVEKAIHEVEKTLSDSKQFTNDLDLNLFHAKEDLLDLKSTFYSSGLQTLKVRSEDHDKAIESLRKDMLDLQVISGTLPSRAGTMRDEVSNALEELKSLQSSYKEQQALLETTKDQTTKLADAYEGLHFTSEEFNQMRERLDEIDRRTKFE